MKAFISDGFTLGAHNLSNQNGETYASWNWKANGAGSANTDGYISSTVSANTTAGFSIAKYTGTGANSSFGHGLGGTPGVYIIKRLNGAAGTWLTYHQSLGIGYHLGLNNNSAQNANDATFANNTAPDTSKIYLGNWGDLNNNGSDFICYSWKEIPGYSKFGSYTGNGNSDGPFIFTGFKPAFVITKRTDAVGDWQLRDSVRAMASDYPQTPPVLEPHSGNTESSIGGWNFEFLSNGFKQRETNVTVNASGGSYIYMAFASAPLVGTNNVPCTAR